MGVSRPGTATARTISVSSSSVVGRTPWTVATCWVSWPGRRVLRRCFRPPLVTSARVASVLSTSNRVDAQTIEHIEAVLCGTAVAGDYALGPKAALSTVLAQRDLARALLARLPSRLTALDALRAERSLPQAGWLSFDLKQFDHAGYYYEDARALAHEAENTGLGAFVLCQMSQLATWQGRPRIGIDHAVAAGQWANRTGDLRLRAMIADVAARAYAADGQRDASMTALDSALTTAADHARAIPCMGMMKQYTSRFAASAISDFMRPPTLFPTLNSP